MRIRSLSLILSLTLLVLGVTACATAPNPYAPLKSQATMNLDQIKQSLVGDWVSIAPEVRPSAAKKKHLHRSF